MLKIIVKNIDQNRTKSITIAYTDTVYTRRTVISKCTTSVLDIRSETVTMQLTVTMTVHGLSICAIFLENYFVPGPLLSCPENSASPAKDHRCVYNQGTYASEILLLSQSEVTLGCLSTELCQQ